MTDFVDRMGRDYFSGRWRGSYFLYEGIVHQFRDLRTSGARCFHLNDSQTEVIVPLSHFTGFDVIKYPELGYRYLPRNGLAFTLKRGITYEPGIRVNNLTTQLTPFTSAIATHTREARPSQEEAVEAAFKPDYHGKDVLDALFSQEIPAYVPGPTVLIEPCCSDENEEFSVFLRGQQIGYVTGGKAKATNTRNKKFIEEVISR